MNQKDIEHLAQGFPPSHIGKDHEEVVIELAGHVLSLRQRLNKTSELANAYNEAEMAWEKAMMAAIGEDGVGNVSEAIAALKAERDAVLAENVMLKSGIGFFSYGPDSGFEEHDSAEKAIEVADIDIGCYREDARDGWAEEVDQVTWGVIMQRATMTGLRPVNEDDNCAEWAEEWCDYTLLPNLETPATNAMLNAVRAEGIYFAANRMLAAWDSGFIDDTPAQAYDISGAVLSAVEFLPDASHGDFKRDFADSIRAEIAAKSRAATDTTPSQYESLAGGK